MIRPGGSGAEDITINLNTFEHCANQIFWTGGSANAHHTIPVAMGNNGSGILFLIGENANFTAIMIGGNDTGHAGNGPLPGSGALYSGRGKPSFGAALGSIYIRTDNPLSQSLYVNTYGALAWRQLLEDEHSCQRNLPPLGGAGD